MTDFPLYNTVLGTQLSEAVEQSETALLGVIRRMRNVHVKARFQADRIGSSSDDLVAVSEEQIRENKQVIQASNAFSDTQSDPLRTTLAGFRGIRMRWSRCSPWLDAISDASFPIPK